jgi:hypothetical protein
MKDGIALSAARLFVFINHNAFHAGMPGEKNNHRHIVDIPRIIF